MLWQKSIALKEDSGSQEESIDFGQENPPSWYSFKVYQPLAIILVWAECQSYTSSCEVWCCTWAACCANLKTLQIISTEAKKSWMVIWSPPPFLWWESTCFLAPQGRSVSFRLFYFFFIISIKFSKALSGAFAMLLHWSSLIFSIFLSGQSGHLDNFEKSLTFPLNNPSSLHLWDPAWSAASLVVHNWVLLTGDRCQCNISHTDYGTVGT